jgi:hypothetical protein
MFSWDNLLLCCADCGRIKGVQFPTDETGQPLLIDPTSDNPWDFLEFDPETGNIVPRFTTETNGFPAKGVETVAALRLDKRESLSEGYLRSLRRIRSVIAQYVAPVGPLPRTSAVVKALRIADEHGIAEWCFKHSGRHERPFEEFFARYPVVAAKIADSL